MPISSNTRLAYFPTFYCAWGDHTGTVVTGVVTQQKKIATQVFKKCRYPGYNDDQGHSMECPMYNMKYFVYINNAMVPVWVKIKIAWNIKTSTFVLE